MSGEATVGTLIREVAARLRAAGIENPRSEARLILAAATGLDRAAQLREPEAGLDPAPVMALAARRERREPLAYLVGGREFYGADFRVGPGVLVPRPETETLIEVVTELMPDRCAPLRIADLGTGTGCLLLTLLGLYPNARGVGVDRSHAALGYARANRRSLGLEARAVLVHGNWLEAVQGPFDLIVANPPYIGTAEPRDPETLHEPAEALLAGPDGLAAYRAIIAPAFAALASGGLLALEIGAGQAGSVQALLSKSGFVGPQLRTDLAGRARVVTARRS